MFKFFRITGLLLLTTSMLLSGCSQAGNSTPTIDAQTAYTQAALTAQGLLTQAALLTPSATNTPIPTETNTPEPPTPTFTATLATPVATATSTLPMIADRAYYMEQTPLDGVIVTPGQDFVVTWKVRNDGTTTWTPQYRLRFFAGTFMSPVYEVALTGNVLPQQEVLINLPIKAPTTAGEYTTIWVLSNAQDANFMNVYLRIVVSGTVAATPTPTNTPAPSATP